MSRTFHRGAAVAITFKGVRVEWDRIVVDIFDITRWRVVGVYELTGAQVAKFSKPSRQRRKGPIVRYGVPR